MIQCAFQIGTAQKVLLAITYKRRHENRVTSSNCLLITDKNKWKEEEEKVAKYSNICIEYRNKLDKIIVTAKLIYENTSYLRII